jgi:hypothetical protein
MHPYYFGDSQKPLSSQEDRAYGTALGAALAVATSIEWTDITDLVLWDPVVNGKAYIDQLTAASIQAH